MILVLFLWVSCQKKASSQYQVSTGSIFHTDYRVVYSSDVPLQDAIDSALAAVNYSANPFDSTSLLWTINNNRSMQADSTLLYLLQTAREIYELSAGAYDVTISPLVNAWGFGFTPPLDPLTPERIDSLLVFIGMDKLRVEGMEVHKGDPRMMLDFSSIAKGLACDQVGEALRRHGVENYLVEIGGEIAFAGHSPRNSPWRIGVNSPSLDSVGLFSSVVEEVIELPVAGGLATSGNYRNFKVDASGRPFGHTLSPITGYPVQHDLLSATVLAPNGAMADALATAFMASGSKRAEEMARDLPGVEYLLILAGDDSLHYRSIISPGMQKLLPSRH